MISRLMAGLGGALLGGAATAIAMEKRARETTVEYKFIDCTRLHVDVERPATDEEMLAEEDKFVTDHDQIKLWEDEVDTGVTAEANAPDVITTDGKILEFKTQNDYDKAIAATETPVEVFVAGGINDYGISYIEEEDFQDEEDGRYKGRIDIMMDDHQPIFLMDGAQIDDWDKRLGDSILVDFYKLVPPGVDPILYVRNHRTGEDYEVVQVFQT